MTFLPTNIIDQVRSGSSSFHYIFNSHKLYHIFYYLSKDLTYSSILTTLPPVTKIILIASLEKSLASNVNFLSKVPRARTLK